MRKGGALLYEGLASGSVEKIITGADKLGGLGVGLTPSGDDFLVGVMYGLRACCPAADAKATSELIFAGAAGKTNSLSRAWMAAAVEGEAVESWHKLIRASSSNQGKGIEKAIREILSIGETSGADALTGFVQLLKLEKDR